MECMLLKPMSILKSLFQFKEKNDKFAILTLGGLISACVFLFIVGFVLYKAFSTVFFDSYEAKADTKTQIEDENLQKAIDLIEKWNTNSN